MSKLKSNIDVEQTTKSFLWQVKATYLLKRSTEYDKLKLLSRINHMDYITFLCSLCLIRDGE